jgi:arylsulfotransferase ASST
MATTSPKWTMPGDPDATTLGEVLGKFLQQTAFVVAIAFLGLIAGSYLVFANAFPGRVLVDAYRGGQALYDKWTKWNEPYPGEFWQPARVPAKGVTVYDPTRTADGFTLFTSGDGQKAVLISMTGQVVHEWQLPFSDVWDKSAAVVKPQPDSLIYWRKAYMYPNGDLLAIYEAAGDTPWGYGLVKVDKDSRVLWKYMEHVHHDLDVGSDGKIYVLTHEVRTNVYKFFKHLEPPRVDDFVVVLSPEGKELQKVSVVDPFMASPYARMTNQIAWYAKGDYFHTNNIDVLDPAAAGQLAPGARQPVLLSMRELGAIGILDLADQSFRWAMRGSWVGQHDPDLLPNGHILLFDNAGNYANGGPSRVIEVDPRTEGVVWSYAGDAEHPLYSIVRSAQERLANGNTLITESEGGRLLEVTPSGEIVWEYINPVRAGDAGDKIAVVSWGQRIDPQTLAPDFLATLSSDPA